MTAQLPKSDHFHLKELADGVFAALARPEGMAACNSGIIDMGNRTAVLDTFLSPEAGADLRRAAEEITGRGVELVLLTHHHFDHIWGNQAFDEKTCIFSSEETLRVIQETGEESLKQNRINAEELLGQRRQKLQAEEDEEERAELAAAIDALEKRLKLIDSIRLRPPNMTCQGPLSFYGTKRIVEFIPYKKAHSPGNSVIRLPNENILFVGDLLFKGMHPFMGDGDPQGWIDVLEKIIALEPKTVVPGHGALATVDDVHELNTYLHVLTMKVKDFIKAGKPAAELGEIELPEPYASWETKDQLKRSLNFLYPFYSA